MIYIQNRWYEYIGIVVLLTLYMGTYYLYGFTLNKLCKRDNKEALSDHLIVGFFIQALVFFVIALPMKWMQIPLHIVAYIWLGVWFVTVVVIIWKFADDIGESLKANIQYLKNNKLIYGIVGGITTVLVVFEALYGRILGGENATYYIGYVTTAVFENRLGMFDPKSGEIMSKFNPTYFLQTYLDHSAVVSFLSKIHPLLEIRVVMPTIIIVISNLVLWKMSRILCEKNMKAQMVMFVSYITILNFFVPSVLASQFYYYFRTFEGKNVFAAIMIPLMFTFFWQMYNIPEDMYVRVCAVISIAGSYMFCMSTIFMVPYMLVCYSPILLLKKNRKLFMSFIWCILPCVLVMAYYIMTRKGIINLQIG